MNNVSKEEKQYDFIVVGAGAAGSVLAAGIVRFRRQKSSSSSREDPMRLRP
jgi:hypothetical protein